MKLRSKNALSVAFIGLLCLLAQACTSPGPAVTSEEPVSPDVAFQQAKQAYTNKDYVNARKLLIAPAEAGHADAQYTLGYMAYYGQGFARDEEQALDWFRKSAAKGNANAIKVLGLLSSDDSQPAPSDDVVVTAIPEQSSDFAQETIAEESTVLAEEGTQAKLSASIPPEVVQPPQQKIESPLSDQWVQNQPREKYTIQLIAGQNEARLKQFVEQNQLQEQVAFVPSSRDGQPWYTLVYGSFDTRDDAKLALKTLPAAVKSNGPWVRLFGEIQALMKP